MNDLAAAALLGIVQGLTEFLPVSSTVHLVLISRALGLDPERFGLSFDVALHLGTALAVLLYFARTWLELASDVLHLRLRMPLLIVIGTLPAAIAGVALQSQVEGMFRASAWIALFLIIGSVIFIAAERFTLARRPLEMPLMDPQSGAARPTSVTLADSRTLTAIEHRERPHGYLVLREGRAVAERLALNEVRACVVEAACRIAVEAYDVERLGAVSRRRSESINPDQSMRVAIRPATIDVPAGALFVPMNQPAAGIVAAALEPDSPGSYLGVGIVPMDDGESEAPVYRVMTDLPFCAPR